MQNVKDHPKRDWKKTSRKFNSAWEADYLVIDLPETEDTVMCLLCSVTLQCKTHNVKKHAETKHSNTINLPKKQRNSLYSKLIQQYKAQKLLDHADHTLRAEYVLAYTVVHAKMPDSAGEHFVTFSRLADPTSSVLHDMGQSGRTMTRRMEDIGRYICDKELELKIQNSPFIGIQIDDSLDKAVHEQCLVYIRLLNFETFQIETPLLAVLKIEGAPTNSRNNI